MEAIEVICKITHSEYVKAIQQYLIESNKIRKRDMILMTGALALAGLTLLSSSDTLRILRIILLVCALVFFAAYVFLYFILPIRLSKKFSKHLEETSVTFTNDSIKRKSMSVEAEWKWNVFSKMLESRDFFFFNFLIQISEEFIAIPKRGFAGPKEIQAFKNMAQTHIKSQG